MITLEECPTGTIFRGEDGQLWELISISYTRAHVRAVEGVPRDVIIRSPETGEVVRHFTATQRRTKDIAPGTEITPITKEELA